MTVSHGEPGTGQDAPLRAWLRLGDLAADGVIISVPGADGARWLTYQMQPPGGGTGWPAAVDASTLLRVSSLVTYASLRDHPLHHQRCQLRNSRQGRRTVSARTTACLAAHGAAAQAAREPLWFPYLPVMGR